MVKGLKSMWRQTAPIVRMTLGELRLPSCCLLPGYPLTSIRVSSDFQLLPFGNLTHRAAGVHAGGAVRRIVMQDDVKAAVAFVESQITRLLAGRCELWEFVMTGVGRPCL